ncbi:MAG: carboxypeptidase regulatory-like domain-containing protein [Elusimicrobiota bacterium]
MLTRCSGCAKEIAEADEVCPFCGCDFSVPVVRKRPRPSPPSDKPEKPKPRPEPGAKARPAPTPKPRRPAEAPPARFMSASSGEPISFPTKKKPSPWPYLVAAGACVAVLAASPLVRYLRTPPPPHPEASSEMADVTLARDLAAAPEPTLDAIRATTLAALTPKKPAPEKASAKDARRIKARKPAEGKPPRNVPVPEEPIILGRVHHPDPSSGGLEAEDDEWRIRGTVFDLLTLAPVSGADVVFTDLKSGEPFRTETGPNGGYRAHLPVRDHGFDLKIRHPGYEPKYIEDSDPSYRKLSQDRRMDLARQAARTLQHKEFVSGDRDTLLNRDYALVPLSW